MKKIKDYDLNCKSWERGSLIMDEWFLFTLEF